MFTPDPFYNETIRNVIVAFGSLFSGIKIKRSDKLDSANDQLVNVPLSYTPKEKWVRRIEEDPSLENHVYGTFPRMGFEILGYNYDAERKLNKNNKIVCNGINSRNEVFTGSPYNLDISLYFITKNTGDGLQILEQILPYFSPDYTISIKTVPSVNIVQDVPIVLNSVSVNDEYDGDLATRRFVTHTLTFTVKIMLYGPVSDRGIITKSIANLTEQSLTYTAESFAPETPIIETWLEEF